MQGCGAGSRLRYRLTLVTGMLECLCFAGLVFGFASLVFVLKADGYFSDLCVSSPGSNSTDCSRQDEQFSLVFTIASFLNNFINIIVGYLFDRFGTLVTRLLGISLYTTGTLLVASSSAAMSILLFPALSCIAVGGVLFLLTNMQIGNLFPDHRSTIITLYNGAFDSSSAVFLLFKILYENNVSLRTSFLVLSFCSVIHLFRTFVLLPRTHIPYTLPQFYTYGWDCRKGNTYNVEQLEKTSEYDMGSSQESSGKDAGSTAAEDGTNKNVESFRSCVLSWFFFLHLLWLSVMQLRHYLFIGTLNPRLTRLANNDHELVSQYTNAFAMTQVCGVLCAPWNGLIMDRHKGKPLPPGVTEQEADLRSSVLSLFLTCLQCLMFSICASIPFLPLQYLTFVLQVLNRSFLYGGTAAFVSIAFPAPHFGKIYGMVMSLSAIVSLLQFPCFSLIEGALGGDPFYVDITLILLTLLVFSHPAYVFFHCRRVAQNRGDQTQSRIDKGTVMAEAKL